MQMRPLWSPVPAWMPILLGSGLLWPEPGAGLQHTTHTHTQKHTHSTPGVIAFQPQGLDFCHYSLTNHPTTHKKKRQGPSVRGARFQAARPISALLQATPASCYYPTPTGFGQRGGKKMRGRKVGRKKKRRPKGRDGKRERDGWKKETFRFFHLLDCDKWPGL